MYPQRTSLETQIQSVEKQKRYTKLAKVKDAVYKTTFFDRVVKLKYAHRVEEKVLQEMHLGI